MRYDFGGLSLREAIVHRSIKMEGQLSRLTLCDQRRNRDQATIASTETALPPKVTEQHIIGVPRQFWCNVTYTCLYSCTAFSSLSGSSVNGAVVGGTI